MPSLKPSVSPENVQSSSPSKPSMKPISVPSLTLFASQKYVVESLNCESLDGEYVASMIAGQESPSYDNFSILLEP